MSAARDAAIILAALALLAVSVIHAFDVEQTGCDHPNDIAQLFHCGRYVR